MTQNKQLSTNQNYKNREELSELLRILSKASNHGSEEHKQLEIKAQEMLDKFGGIDAMFKELDKIQKVS